jgi:hypothetical protein
MNVLRPILVHAVDQIRGGDHVRTDGGAPGAGAGGDADRPAQIA